MPPDDLNDLEKKLAAFRGEQKREPDRNAERERDAENMNRGLRAGTELVVSIAAGTLIGWFLDQWLGTKPLFLLLFIMAGIGAGFFNVYRITQDIGTAPGFKPLHNRKKDAKNAPEEEKEKKEP